MKFWEKQLFDYDDITIIPDQPSYVDSRSKVDISGNLCGIKLGLPIVAAPMPDVCNTKMCNALRQIGAIGIIHRFQSIDEQVAEFNLLSHDGIAAIGVTGDYLERLKRLFNEGCNKFCLDTANGANIKTEQAIYSIKKVDKNIKLIAGNVASGRTFRWLSKCGVDAIRVGIAGGSGCATRNQTGIYHPMASLIREIYEYRQGDDIKCQIIADGGIKGPQDMCKALALGADLVMIGGLFASCLESPARTMKLDGRLYKVFRGAASFSVQQEYGTDERPDNIEGFEKLIPYEGPLQRVISKFEDGLRSSLSYLNALNLEQYRTSAVIGVIK